MSICRITVIKLKETPKFLVGEGRDAECVETLQFISNKYNRPCSLTLEQMQSCGDVVTRAGQGKSKWGLGGVWGHCKGLYSTKRIGISTTLIWLSWTLIGLVGVPSPPSDESWVANENENRHILYSTSSFPPISALGAQNSENQAHTLPGETTPSPISAASGVPCSLDGCAKHG
jgi:hypothetical protein